MQRMPVAVLVISAVDAQRRMCCDVLQNAGFCVTEASEADQALHLASATLPALILLHMDFPGARDLLEQLKSSRQTPSAPIIQISRIFADPKERARALDDGATACLPATYRNEELIATMRAIARVCTAQQDRNENARRLRLAYSAGKMWSWEIDPQLGKIIRSEEAAHAGPQFDLLEENISAWMERVHPDDRQRLCKTIETSLAGKSVYETDVRLLWPDGSYRWVYARGARVQEASGHFVLSGVAMDITERKRAEEELQLAKERLVLALKAGRSGIFDWDIQKNVNMWSEELERLHGFQPGEFGATFEHFHECVIPEDRPLPLAAIEVSIRTGELEGEWRIRRRNDGQVRWISARGQIIFDQTHKPIRMIGVNADITERKQAEEALRESEQRLARTQDFSLVMALHVGLEGQWLKLPPTFCDFLGYNHKELIGRSFKNVTHPDDFWADWSQCLRLISGEINSFEMEKRFIRKDGSIVWGYLNCSVVTDECGKPVHFLTYVRDITQQKRMEQEVVAARKSAETSLGQLRATLDSMAEGVYVVDSEMRPLLGNAALWRIYGLPPETLSDGCEKLFSILQPTDLNGKPVTFAECPIRAALTGDVVRDRELRIRRSDTGSEAILSHNAAPVCDSNNKTIMVVLTVEDITAKKQAEQALVRSEKLASVGRMAATIAHEINNPLEAAINAIFLACSDKSLSNFARSNLDIAEKELARVAHITKQTLGFYKQSGQPTAVRLPELIDGILHLYAPKLRNKSIRVRRRYTAIDQIVGFEGELRQIISNLIANSIDAIQQNGTLHLRTNTAKSLNGDRAMIRLTVADTGSGIPCEDLKRIYEPFFTTKQAIGTGLGLWVTNELVRKHDGKIRVRSRVGKGTVFMILLPIERRNEDRTLPGD